MFPAQFSSAGVSTVGPIGRAMGSVNVSLSPAFTVQMQGGPSTEADARRFMKAAHEYLKAEIRTGELGSVIVQKVRNA